MSKLSSNEQLKAWLRIAKYFRLAMTKGQRRFLLASVVLHIVVVILLSWSWNSTEAVKTYVIPNSIEARVLTAEEVDRLPFKQKQRQLELDKAKQEKQKALKKKQALAKKKKLEEAKRKKDAEKKAAQKKAAEQKKLQLKKQEALKKKQTAEKQKAEQARKLAAQRKAEELAAKRKQDAKKDVDRLKALSELRQQKLREQRLAERLKGIEDLKAANVDAEPVFDVDEKTRYLSIIRNRIESRWRKPPNAVGSYVVMRIQLCASGELSSVDIIDSSGNDALDQSALRAVKAVNKFEVPKDTAFFEKYFRSFQMSFRPED